MSYIYKIVYHNIIQKQYSMLYLLAACKNTTSVVWFTNKWFLWEDSFNESVLMIHNHKSYWNESAKSELLN